MFMCISALINVEIKQQMLLLKTLIQADCSYILTPCPTTNRSIQIPSLTSRDCQQWHIMTFWRICAFYFWRVTLGIHCSTKCLCPTYIVRKVGFEFRHTLAPIGSRLLADQLNVQEGALPRTKQRSGSGSTHNTRRHIGDQILHKTKKKIFGFKHFDQPFRSKTPSEVRDLAAPPLATNN